MRILVVDDSKAMRMMVIRSLKQAGFAEAVFDEAGHGKEALDRLAAAPADLVCSDWNMPEMNGLEVLQALRAAGNGVRFGFLTSEASEKIRALGLAAGASFFVTKPFTAESIAQAVGPVPAAG